MLWKEILRPGRWTLRSGQIFDCSHDDLTFYCDRINAMCGRRLLIPLCWEHQPRAVPMSAADWHELHTDVAKHTITHIRGAEIRDGKLGVLLEPDQSDLTQLRKTGYVSPYIDWDYTDPSGFLWEGPSLLHVAVTPVPIQIEQEPFVVRGGDGAFLSSVAEWRKSPKQKRQPVMLSGARVQPIFLGSNMAKDKVDEAPEDEIVVDDEPATPEPPPPPPPAPTMPSEAEMRIKEALTCAAYEGLMLGNDTTIDNFIDRFITACRTKRAVEDKMKSEEETEVNEPTNPASSEPGEEDETTPGPVLMSQAEQASLKKRHDAFADRLVTMHRQGLAGQIKSLSKQLGDDGVTELLNKLQKAPLALSSAGTLEDCKELVEIHAELRVAQRLKDRPKDKFKAAALSQKVSSPHDGTGNVPDTEQSKKSGRELAAMYMKGRDT